MLGNRTSALVITLVLLMAAARPISAQAQVPSAPRAHSLAELVAIAEERSPTLAVARQTVKAAEAAVAVARAGLGVTLTAKGSAQAAGGSAATTTTYSSAASLVASYTLYDSGQTAYAVAQAEANLRSAQAALEATRQDVALAVGQAYIAVLRAEHSVALQQQQVVRNQELVRVAQGQFEAGVVAKSDVVRAQAGLAAARSDLISAQNSLDQTRASLAVAVGASATTPLSAAPAPSVPPITVTQADLARLVEQRPELRKALAEVEAALAAVRLAQAGGGLKVSLEGAASQTFSPSTQTTYVIGAGVSFPVSDAGRASAATAQAAANLQAARARVENVRLTTVQDGVSALLSLGSAQARTESARASLAYAEESLNLARARYEAGAAPIYEVIEAQTTLLAAEVALAGAQFDQLSGVLQLRRALGRSVVDGAI